MDKVELDVTGLLLLDKEEDNEGDEDDENKLWEVVDESDVALAEVMELEDGEPIDDSSVDSFFEEVTFLNLKDIIIAGNNFKFAKPFFGELSKQKFIELMDILNSFRRKIAHVSRALVSKI